MDAELAARLRANDRKVYFWLGVCAIAGLAILAAFLTWRVDAEQRAWEQRDALFRTESVYVIGTLVRTHSSTREVIYSWEWAGAHHEANLHYCKPIQGEWAPGAKVPLRIVPSSPGLLRCGGPDSLVPGPPSYWNVAFFMIFVLGGMVNLVRSGFESNPDEKTNAPS